MKTPRFRIPRIRLCWVIAACVVLAIGVILCLYTAQREERDCIELQLEAALRMEEAEAWLKERILARGIEIEKEDLNRTALMGPEFTELTTTPGNEDAKRTALNPNFAAAMVRWYTEAGLKAGDTIAIGTSGSFPGFIIASTIAATVMELDVRLIASLGSSMHGATRLEYNVFDLLWDLREGGWADFNLLAVSGGGKDDLGVSAFEDFLYEGTEEIFASLVDRAAERFGAETIREETLTGSINRRQELYGDGIKLFVNIGGSAPNSGSSSYTLNFPQGLVLRSPEIPDVPDRGLNFEFAARGIPVLNLLNVKLLAQENGIVYDSVPMERAGQSGVYASVSYNPAVIILTIILTVGILIRGAVAGWIERRKLTRGCRPSSADR